MTLLELECKLYGSSMSFEDFKYDLWTTCISRKPEYKKQMRQFERFTGNSGG